jgi:NADH-quinone oxidoreductase subunit G
MTAADIEAADQLGALLLVERELPATALAAASAVIAFAQFRDEGLDEHADVVFPAEIYPEKEGTITHPDGRLQRVRQALGRANEVRPAWHVLADLCERVGAGVGALSARMVTDRLAEAVPFYAGITLDEIGGLGVRWQERDAASALAAEAVPSEPLADPPPAPDGLRLAAVPTLWTGPELDHSPSLGFLARAPRVELSAEDAREAGIAEGDEVRLVARAALTAGDGSRPGAGGPEATAVAAIRSGVAPGTVILTGAELPDGPVALAPARPPVEAVAAGEVAR